MVDNTMEFKHKIKIGYFADGPWSHEAFNKIIADPTIEIRFIVPRNDSKDTTLKELAHSNQIPFLTGVKVNSPEFYEKAKEFDCDLFVSMSYNQIFRNKIHSLPKLHTINCHAGKLPFYRGRNILNWALINDEKEFGITVHFVDDGIDTGDIILQRDFEITDQDDYHSLLQRSYAGCAHILYDAIKLIQNDDYERIDQNSIHPFGTYFGIRTIGDEIINWNWTSREIFNFTRAIASPGPIARTSHKEEEVLIKKTELIESAIPYKATNGQILSIKQGVLYVKTGDTVLKITEYESPIKLRVGDRFL